MAGPAVFAVESSRLRFRALSLWFVLAMFPAAILNPQTPRHTEGCQLCRSGDRGDTQVAQSCPAICDLHRGPGGCWRKGSVETSGPLEALDANPSSIPYRLHLPPGFRLSNTSGCYEAKLHDFIINLLNGLEIQFSPLFISESLVWVLCDLGFLWLFGDILSIGLILCC